jgi:alpha-1,2-mannosyltransferase
VKVLSFPRLLADRFRAAYTANPRRLRLAFFALLAVIVVLMSVKYAIKISKPGDGGQQSRSAFLRWRSLVNGVFAGENIYVGLNEYPNPPIMAVLLRPFAALPPAVGAMAWFYAKVLLAVLAALWVFRLVAAREETSASGGHQPPESTSTQTEQADNSSSLTSSPLGGLTPPARRGDLKLDLAKAAAIVLCLPALLGDLSHNNVNIFILFLVVGCLEAFRKRLDTLAGLTLALAVACKVTPLLFVAYFAWKRCWRVLAATLAGLVLWLAVVPGLTFGWDRNRELMTGWYALMVERPLLKGEITTEHPNQAIPGFVYRLFTHSPSFITYAKTPEGDIPTPAAYHNLTDIGRPAAWVVVKAPTAGFVLAVVLLCRWPVRGAADSRQGWRFAAECGLICLGMLLFSERTWKHHAVVLLLPLAALTYAVAVVELPRRVRNFLFGVLVASFVLTAGPGVLGARANDLAMVYGTHTLAFVLQTVAVGLLLACGSGRVGGPCGLRPSPNPG